MPQTNNIISPVQRLMIAVQIFSARATRVGLTGSPSAAISDADELIAESGCIVEGAEVPAYEMD